MSDDRQNPYAATHLPVSNEPVYPGLDLDAATLKKIEAIIKDAGQFWLAIALCFFCAGCGMLIIGPWYIVRLVQWNSLAAQYPGLLEAGASVGSLPYRFRKARTRLYIAIILGGLLFIALAGFGLLGIFVDASRQPGQR
jgi:hypothetical protein